MLQTLANDAVMLNFIVFQNLKRLFVYLDLKIGPFFQTDLKLILGLFQLFFFKKRNIYSQQGME